MNKLPHRIFVSGIGTGVGKTVACAVLVEALQCDYWKPVQCGGLENSDTMIVRSLVANGVSEFHDETYRLNTASSPHYAAKVEGVTIEIPKVPDSGDKRLIIEGAGGLMVPLNERELVIDIPQQISLPVVLVVSNYLGSINHTLLSIEVLKSRGVELLGLIFTGQEFLDNETIIEHFGKVPVLGKIEKAEKIDKDFVLHQSQQVLKSLSKTFIL